MSKNLKKERFNKKSNNNSVYLVAGVAIVLIIAVAAYLALGGKNDNQQAANGGSVAGTTAGAQVQEVTVTPTVAGDKLIIKKSDVENNKIVKFDYTGAKLTLKSGAKVDFPLLAYITPSGKINVAVRMCEPCNGLSFSIIDGKILNCNTCGTQWDIETNQWNGVGAQYCGSFAPEIKPFTTNGDNLEIKIADFKDWLPRA